jgi:hypothetical protein
MTYRVETTFQTIDGVSPQTHQILHPSCTPYPPYPREFSHLISKCVATMCCAPDITWRYWRDSSCTLPAKPQGCERLTVVWATCILCSGLPRARSISRELKSHGVCLRWLWYQSSGLVTATLSNLLQFESHMQCVLRVQRIMQATTGLPQCLIRMAPFLPMCVSRVLGCLSWGESSLQ